MSTAVVQKIAAFCAGQKQTLKIVIPNTLWNDEKEKETMMVLLEKNFVSVTSETKYKKTGIELQIEKIKIENVEINPCNTEPNPTTGSFKILTFNILNESAYLEIRLKSLFEILKNANIDILTFQEVSFGVYKKFCALSWLRDNYFSINLTNCKYFEKAETLMYSKFPMTEAYYREISNAHYLLCADTKIHDRKIKIQIVHLKAGKEFEKMRQKQIEDLLSDSQNKKFRNWQDRIILGDFNFKQGSAEGGDESNVNTIKQEGFIDCWEEYHTNHKSKDKTESPSSSAESSAEEKDWYTFNVEENDMAKRTSENGVKRGRPPSQSCRTDRIYLSSQYWKVTNTLFFGKDPIQPVVETTDQPSRNIFISDHFGILTTLSSPS